MKQLVSVLAVILMIVVFTPVISYAAKTTLEAPDLKAAVSSSTVSLKWSKVSGAKGYQIYRATGKNGKYKKIRSTSKTSFKNKKLKTGKMYFYKVRSYKKSGGKVVYSKFNRVAATPLGKPVCKCSSMVKMNKVRTNGVSKATGYAVYRSTSKNGGYKKIGTTKTLYYNDKSAVVGTVYYYKMRAYKTSGGTTTYGPSSASGRGSRLLMAPKAKFKLSPDPSDPAKNQGIEISWNKVEGAKGYEVYKSSNAGKSYTRIYKGTKLSYVDKKCKNGTTYYYKVRGYRTIYGVTDYGYSSPSKHSRDTLLNQGKKWLGYSKANGKYKRLVKIYNDYKPLPRDVKAGYKEAWCTTFVTAASIKTGLVDIMPRERICRYMISLYQELGLWVENDAYKPKRGDLIMYSHKDSGKGDCKQPAKHIGIVVSVSNGKIKVLEGNHNGKVAYRTVKINGRYIRGFATPKYDVNNGIKFVLKRNVPKEDESLTIEEPVTEQPVTNYVEEQTTEIDDSQTEEPAPAINVTQDEDSGSEPISGPLVRFA